MGEFWDSTLRDTKQKDQDMRGVEAEGLEKREVQLAGADSYLQHKDSLPQAKCLQTLLHVIGLSSFFSLQCHNLSYP